MKKERIGRKRGKKERKGRERKLRKKERKEENAFNNFISHNSFYYNAHLIIIIFIFVKLIA